MTVQTPEPSALQRSYERKLELLHLGRDEDVFVEVYRLRPFAHERRIEFRGHNPVRYHVCCRLNGYTENTGTPKAGQDNRPPRNVRPARSALASPLTSGGPRDWPTGSDSVQS